MRAIKTDLVLCLKNEGFEVSLEPRKIYRVIPERSAASEDLLRIIDESGEDYLYPADFFALVKLPASVRRQVFAKAG